MSLAEAYFLAHSAQCRLKTEASRPDRNLRFLVGHLMHYENMRLRIVQIESDSGSEDDSDSEPIASKNASRVIDELGQNDGDDNPWSDEDVDDDQEFDDDEDDGLGLQRFPSAAAQPHRHHHSEHADSSRDAAPIEPSPEALQQAIQAGEDGTAKELYERVRGCPCNSTSHAPHIERAWELPSGIAGHEGQRLLVAEVGG